ncbi:IGF-like family receptor 1 isoform X2 [Parambassis ranga]|uniref:IGF-like family receptor 1 isoform X2 n=1 Tax=Parambassis ranga TaxID=210632 RepID=A0A6P7JUQ1_9TELE|nr:IGF-like family receptor 1 isoform X2 [Parambassis ranga]
MMMGYSTRCRNRTTYWDRASRRCVDCQKKAGHSVTLNCGYDDDGSRHDVPFEPCANGTFNDGSSAHCKPCSSCPPGHDTVRHCNTTTDTLCYEPRSPTTTLPVTTEPPYQAETSTLVTVPTNRLGNVAWAVPLGILFSIILMALSAYIMKVKWKKAHLRGQYMNPSFSSLTTTENNPELEDILSPNVLSAPLQKVLDNLDVLEELVILLDPETNGIKNTKHLASLCYFTSTWINYTYSMKESKSPLKAVLEGVSCRHPDWTVGNLAKLLRQIERNDAIAALARLRLNEGDLY